MLRTICNYFRQCKSEHDYELLANVKEMAGKSPIGYVMVYRCKKCGFVQKVRF